MEALKRVSPEKVGIHSQCIVDFIRQVRAEGIELHSLMILRHGKVCEEAWWKPYDSGEPNAGSILRMRIFHRTYMQAWMGHIMYLMSVERSLRQVHAGRKKMF